MKHENPNLKRSSDRNWERRQKQKKHKHKHNRNKRKWTKRNERTEVTYEQ